MSEKLSHISELLIESGGNELDEGVLPTAIVKYRNKLPWPFNDNESLIYLAAFFGSKDLVDRDRIHEGVDFHVKVGTTVTCIEDGWIIYGRDDERGFTFGNLLIQGTVTGIRYRYCHLALDSLPWDIQSLWGMKREYPKVKAGQLLGKVASWFNDIPEDIELPPKLEKLYGRKRDHLHLETSYSPDNFFALRATPAVLFNPLLVLQKPEEYF